MYTFEYVKKKNQILSVWFFLKQRKNHTKYTNRYPHKTHTQTHKKECLIKANLKTSSLIRDEMKSRVQFSNYLPNLKR